jgi:hypothetical protein
VGGAAILLSNKPIDGFRAKYKLLETVRVQVRRNMRFVTMTVLVTLLCVAQDTSDTAYRCVFQTQDTDLVPGVALSKDITVVAGAQ